MVDKFLAFIKEKKIVSKGDSVLLAVSGGVDSVAMLDLFLQVRKSLDLKLGVAHVNYNLREEAKADETFVRSLAARHKLPIFVHEETLIGKNIEEKARQIRYKFFDETCSKEGFGKVAVAHQKNDLAETLLLNLTRGTGLDGLSPMPVKRGHIIRPLLFAIRFDIERYSKARNLKYVSDKTNKDIKFSRNRIRHNVLPEIIQLNPAFLETTSKETALFADISDFFEALAKELMSKSARFDNQLVEIELANINNETDLSKRFFYRAVLEKLSGLKDIESKHIEELLRLSASTSGSKQTELPNGLLAKRVYDRMFIGPVSQKRLPEGKKASVMPLALGKNRFEGHVVVLEAIKNKDTKAGGNLVEIDYEKTGPLLVRFKRDGDRITIGESLTKKLQDIFTDKKIPKHLRNTIPVVTTVEGEVVWICGVRQSEKFRAKADTKKILRIKLEEKN